MRPVGLLVCAAFCAAVVWLGVGAAVGSAPQAEGVKISLVPEAGGSVPKTFTPLKAVSGGKPFQFKGMRGELSIGGKPVPIEMRYAADAFHIGLDCSGNGTVEPKEFVKLDQSLSATYQVKADDKAFVVRLVNVRYGKLTTGEGLTSGTVTIQCAMKGSFNGEQILLFDDDMDGTFTQDGKDAIAIGKSPTAVPLEKFHQVGSGHYQLAVADDGKSITFTKLKDLKLGVVETPFKTGLKCLALTSTEGYSYNVADSGRTGIPAGEYKLSYGVVATGSQMAVIRPTKDCPTYPIEADKINRLRIGPHLVVDFTAEYSNRTVTVAPNVVVHGSGGETYYFDYGGGIGRPHVILAEGNRRLSDTPMSYG